MNGNGFSMPFSSNMHALEKDTDMVIGLMEKAGKILEASAPPVGVAGCEDCQRLSSLVQLLDLK
ncbi:MAG: hypothetical protein M1533_00590 [Candidatus Thermoplasmatota archaeon]|nr:hypothetical protein [Candidatus Thermoplasmatota archaeon]MCL5793903.1 hypothetical protein [Candidatus Thermoplasmatota archaeon]